jgi:hypothetical protein
MQLTGCPFFGRSATQLTTRNKTQFSKLIFQPSVENEMSLMRGKCPVAAVPGAGAVGSYNSEMIRGV